MFGIAVILIISAGSLIAATRLFGRYYNPVSLYVIPWMLCAMLAASGLFGIYQPKETTLITVAVSISGFAIGAIVAKDMFKLVHGREYGGSAVQKEIVSPTANATIAVMCSIATCISVFYLSKTVPLLLSGQGFEYIKFQYSNTVGSTLFTTRELLVFQWAVTPVYYAAFIVFAYDLSKMYLNVKALLFSIIGMTTIVLVSGGRNSIFVFLLICLMGMLCSSNKKSILSLLRGLPLAVKMAAVVAVLVLVYITQERSLSEDAGVIENVFFYFAGAIRYLDYILTHPALFAIGEELFYGRGLLGFIVNPIDLIFSMVFRYDYQSTETLISAAASLYVPLSDKLYGNALCTCIYTFIRDFGLPGIFIGPFLYGVLSSFVWGKAFSNEYGSPAWKCIWIYYAYCLVFSEWRYMLIFPATGITFALIMFTFRSAEKTRVKHPLSYRDVGIGSGHVRSFRS